MDHSRRQLRGLPSGPDREVRDGIPSDFAASAKSKERFFERVSAYRYRVRGRVAYADRTSWVFDFGLLAYDYTKPPRIAKKGAWLDADIYLGIDPFFYFKELHARPKMPKLQYDWRI